MVTVTLTREEALAILNALPRLPKISTTYAAVDAKSAFTKLMRATQEANSKTA